MALMSKITDRRISQIKQFMETPQCSLRFSRSLDLYVLCVCAILCSVLIICCGLISTSHWWSPKQIGEKVNCSFKTIRNRIRLSCCCQKCKQPRMKETRFGKRFQSVLLFFLLLFFPLYKLDCHHSGITIPKSSFHAAVKTQDWNHHPKYERSFHSQKSRRSLSQD